MDTQQYQHAKRLFEAVRSLDGDSRNAYLDEQCGEDPAVREEVESLLYSHDRLTDFLEAPALGDGFGTDVSPLSLADQIEETPDRIGHFAIETTLGEGGMGIVYLATQDQPKRRVALKVIRAGVASKQMLARFEHEAQVLATLQHAGIAHVYEAGTMESPSGPQPYFAMEYIQGDTLLTHAKSHSLGNRDRLALMAKICAAVEHAHQRGVIHRDLKPGNILVARSEENAEDQPKILDFGIARATDADIRTATLRTDIGQLVGTVPYMSPEQAAGDPKDIDARSDVYTLGVVLYELLTDRLPHDVAGKMIHEAVRSIREDDPTPISVLNPALRGDLETIVGKALEKDKDRRYQSAAALQADLTRYLEYLPISARPPSTLYQLRKFTRRNRSLVSSVVAMFIVLIGGIIGTSFGLARATTARDDARRNEQVAQSELAKAEQVTAFLQKLLAGSGPWIAAGRDTTLLRSVLDEASENLGPELTVQPEAEILIRNTIGDTYRTIGEHEQAESHLKRALELCRQHHQPDDEVYRKVRRTMGWLREAQGQSEAALDLFEENIESSTRRLGELDPDTIKDQVGRLTVLRDQFEYFQINEITKTLLPRAREVNGESHESTLQLSALRAISLNRLGFFAESIRMHESLLEHQSSLYGRHHPHSMSTLMGLASIYRRQGRLADAEPLHREYVEHCIEVFGSEHENTASAKNSLGLLYRQMKHYEEAEQLFLEALATLQKEIGATHTNSLSTMFNLSGLYRDMRRLEEATEMMRQRLMLHRERFGPTHKQTLLAQVNLAVARMNAGQVDDSLATYAEAISTAQGVEGFDRSFLGYFLLLYSQGLFVQSRYEEIEEHLAEAWPMLVETMGANHRQTHNAALTYVNLYKATGEAEQAQEWQSKADAILAAIEAQSRQ